MDNFFNNKKVLITGHTGFKGSWLTQVLLREGAQVIGAALPPNTNPDLFGVLKLKEKIKDYVVDIRDFQVVKDLIMQEKPEIVFHLAAQAIVRDSYETPLKTYATNTLGTTNILQAIKESGCVKSVVIITTDKVYENKEWLYPYRENDSLGGYDPYSASKAAADIIANSYIQSFFNPQDFGSKHETLVAIARAGNVIGGGDWAPYRIVPDIVRAIYEKNGVITLRNPQAVRPWEHVLEPLFGYMLLAQKLYQGEMSASGAWNFGPNDDGFVPVQELVTTAITLLGKGAIQIQPDTSKHETNLLKLDTSKAKSILGWKPRLMFDESAAFAFLWYKNYYEHVMDPIEFTNLQIKNFIQHRHATK